MVIRLTAPGCPSIPVSKIRGVKFVQRSDRVYVLQLSVRQRRELVTRYERERLNYPTMTAWAREIQRELRQQDGLSVKLHTIIATIKRPPPKRRTWEQLYQLLSDGKGHTQKAIAAHFACSPEVVWMWVKRLRLQGYDVRRVPASRQFGDGSKFEYLLMGRRSSS